MWAMGSVLPGIFDIEFLLPEVAVPSNRWVFMDLGDTPPNAT